jgi:hypothetical protein
MEGMEHHTASSSQLPAPSRQDTGSFRKLVERKITIDEYVRDLDQRTSELRESAPPREAESA